MTWLYREYVNGKRAEALAKGKRQKLEVKVKVEKIEDDEGHVEAETQQADPESRMVDEGKEKEKGGEDEDTRLRKNDEEAMHRYEHFFNMLLETLKAKLDPTDTLFTKVLLEAPELTTPVLQTLKVYCEDQQR